jgi:hypothetical protein
MMKNIVRMALLTFMFLALTSHAKGETSMSPQAGGRTYGQNYKDMVFATCIATAYRDSEDAAIDAGSSVSALRDWTYYDLEKGPDAISSLVNGYLARNYHNPLVESEIKGVRFDFLKCLDLYHSQELDAQVEDIVIDPERTFRKDALSEGATPAIAPSNDIALPLSEVLRAVEVAYRNFAEEKSSAGHITQRNVRDFTINMVENEAFYIIAFTPKNPGAMNSGREYRIGKQDFHVLSVRNSPTNR